MTAIFIFGISVYTIILLLIGFFANRYCKTLQEYLIANRQLSFILVIPTLVATWFGAGSCMGVSGTVYAQGFYGVIADPFGCSLALLVAGLFFAIPLHRSKIMTLSDILGHHYGEHFEWVATLVMLPFYIGTLASQMIAMGTIFSVVTGMKIELGILLGSGIVLAYTAYGGMWAVTLTDFVQFFLLLLALILILPICFNHTKGNILFHNFFNEFSNLLPHANANTSWSSYFGRIFLTGLGAIMGQDLISRLVSSRSENVAKYSAIFASFLYLSLGFIPLLIGIAGRDIFTQLENPEQLIPLLAKTYLGPIGFTFFACGLLAAIMSTADSYLLAGTSLLVKNIFLKKWKTHCERKKITLLKYTHLGLALIALGLAFSGTSIFDLMVHSGSTLFVAIFVPCCMAIFFKSYHRLSAWTSFSVGIFVWLFYIMCHFSDLTTHHEDILFSAAFFGAIFSLISFCVVSNQSIRRSFFNLSLRNLFSNPSLRGEAEAIQKK